MAKKLLIITVCYQDIVKSRADICKLVVDLCPGTVLKQSGPHRRKMLVLLLEIFGADLSVA